MTQKMPTVTIEDDDDDDEIADDDDEGGINDRHSLRSCGSIDTHSQKLLPAHFMLPQKSECANEMMLAIRHTRKHIIIE